MKSNLKRYSLALLGLILFSSGICILGESIIMNYASGNWVLLGTLSLILINAGLGFMIKYKWGSF